MKVIVTAGPTFEPIDPVRFIGNRSSGKQGYAIAKALASSGHDVELISGPTCLSDIDGVKMTRIETAKEMLDAVHNAHDKTTLCDIIICAAAVADWAPIFTDQKIKKCDLKASTPKIEFTENPDILKTISNHKNRPKLVIGFAAETEKLLENAIAKRTRKGCDWILANDVSENIFGQDKNHVYLITNSKQEDWGEISKTAIADKLVNEIKEFFECQK